VGKAEEGGGGGKEEGSEEGREGEGVGEERSWRELHSHGMNIGGPISLLRGALANAWPIGMD
jgi:hypothetical protein